jgi:transposase
MLTGGHVADCTAGEQLLEQMPHASMLHGDKGYDSNAIRRQVEGKGAMPNIPPKANRRWKNCFSPVLYRNRNAIERMFGRLKDFRRIATRYDRGRQLPRRCMPRGYRQLLVMSPDPNAKRVRRSPGRHP